VLSNYPILIVLIFGLANLFAADKDVYKSVKEKELYEIKHNRELEKWKQFIFCKKEGFSKEEAQKLTDLY
jgi:hypothetical protein